MTTRIIIRLSYNNLRNICHNDSVSNWAQRIGEQESSTSRVYAIFFYHLNTINKQWEDNLAENKFMIKERLSNRLLIITDSNFYYPFDTTRLMAMSLWREISLSEAIKINIIILQKKFAFLPTLFDALCSVFSDYQWKLTNGQFRYYSNNLIKSFDYATLCDDIFFAHKYNDPVNSLENLNLEDLDCSSSFPTTSVNHLFI